MDRGEREKLIQGRNPWQCVKYAWLYSDLPQALKGELWSSGFYTDESLISASAAPHCGERFNKSVADLQRRVATPLVAAVRRVQVIESFANQQDWYVVKFAQSLDHYEPSLCEGRVLSSLAGHLFRPESSAFDTSGKRMDPTLRHSGNEGPITHTAWISRGKSNHPERCML